MKKEYDYLIVGSGLFGSVFAHEATKIGKKCLVIDKRNHSGGNIHCENIEGINVHKYGPHIFHTNDKKIWDYVNQFADFNHFVYSPLSFSKGKLYNLPFNMNTFYQLWGTKTPEEAKAKIEEQVAIYGFEKPKNLEEQALSIVGKDIYEQFIKEYTEKQWGRKATDLPAFIIKRIPIRFTFDNNYFNDKYQGIPTGGYNKIIENLLKNVEVKLSTNYFENKEFFENIATKIVFTGKIDEYFDYQYGKLEYRSLRFESEKQKIFKEMLASIIMIVSLGILESLNTNILNLATKRKQSLQKNILKIGHLKKKLIIPSTTRKIKKYILITKNYQKTLTM